MASKLCCAAEQEGHPDSPELPNARVAEAPTPARLPLLPKPVSSVNSRFTSARTEDLHELRQIFDNVEDNEQTRVSPTKSPGRTRFNKPSIYSLHSLHKMKSMRSLIRRKFSRDLLKKPSEDQIQSANAKGATPAPDTVLKQQEGGPNSQVKITKDDLKKNLLSNKRPDEGGYDSDAQVLDDIAKNIGKKTPNKRPSIHSIDWTTSTGSKPTPESSSKSCQSSDRTHDLQPYHIRTTQSVSLSTRIGQVFTSPNLQVETSNTQERKLRRSHSATSIRLPEHSPLFPLRLPSIKTHDPDGIPWSVALNESLRLSQFPVPPRPLTPKGSQASPKVRLGQKRSTAKLQNHEHTLPKEPLRDEGAEPPTPSTVVKIRVQEPTALTTPRQSGSLRIMTRGGPPPATQEPAKEHEDTDDDQTRRSVHLYSMRISHHLRSGSLLSWDTLANESEAPSPSSAFRDCSFSNLNRISKSQQQPGRHERQTSSSGFASSRVPSKWGKVVTDGVREDKSSIYSSRPQSPPDSPLDSLGGSMINLSQTPMHAVSTGRSSLDLDKLKRTNSYPTDNDNTPKPSQRHGLTNLRDVTSYSALTRRSNETSRLARNNSVASTKKSKFHEEFSPSPPKKKLIPSVSIMRFFTPKRNSMRSRSEANMKADDVAPAVDGSLEVLGPTTQRDHRQSKSMISLEAEQKALGKDKKASPMWERALQNYQDEKAAMLLPENKDQATHASPFRERSGSVAASRVSGESEVARELNVPKRFSTPLLDPPSPGTVEFSDPPNLFTRRTAFTGTESNIVDPKEEAQLRFAQQTDTVETVGAWGRYPSHTRADRTLSAGHSDQVHTRDFALEAAIKFAMGKNNDGDNDEVDPATRPVTPPLLPGQKKQKKKVGNTRMAKSHSMTFGKSFLKNYAKLFKSQSIEFHKHGQGHRSSIATGGTLEYPELEILPDVWRRGIIEEASRESNHNDEGERAPQEEYGPGDKKGKGKMKEEDSGATLRSLPASSSRPTTGNLLQAGLDGTRDTARVWSAYYENCLPSFPRASTELDNAVEDFGAPARRSFESRRASMHSRTMPVRKTKHSRNASRMSHFSIASHGSARPSFVSMGENDVGGVDERSMVSVRRSTMDLISMYKEQENTEMERVLKLVRTESIKGL